MLPGQSAQDFVAKWRKAELAERGMVQEHFLDLCRLVGHPSPADFDPTGREFAFEMGAEKTAGGSGWADVAKIGFFGWEYKGKHADLDKAYQQLLQYRESLRNPPLLVVSDTDRIIIHTNFTNTPRKVVELTLDDLLTGDGLRTLHGIFFEPDSFRPQQTTEQVTQQAAEQFSRLAALLQNYGADPQKAAHFLIRLLFCLFAEDIGLLPAGIIRRLVDQTRRRPKDFSDGLGQLFGKMATGGLFGADRIVQFNGGLFNDDSVLDLNSDGLDILASVDRLDWSSIEPSIFGTLFERGLDPSKRSQIGAHFTGKEDIVLIVEPVLMRPLRSRWASIKAQAQALAEKRDQAQGQRRSNLERQLRDLLIGFATELAAVRVLDPACGSGNFLYIALRLLLDLWKDVSTQLSLYGFPRLIPSPDVAPSPAQLHGIEINGYAYELAQATIWIGYIQWLQDNGFGFPPEPILKPLVTIQRMDAILAYDAEGRPVEPEWPEADVIVGNPPFLGDKKMRRELDGERSPHYVDDLRHLYQDRLGGQSDLVCYWFEKARAAIEAGKLTRAGLLSTNSIRSGTNRNVLERIKQSGDIFWAHSDRSWILDGAAVRVSMVGFDNGQETERSLDGISVTEINSALSSRPGVTRAKQLVENSGICFLGMMKAGPFDLDAATAQSMLRAPLNPNGRPNSDVVKGRRGGQDVTGRPRDAWIIDFGVDTSLEQAAQYEQPFEYVRTHVKPRRDSNRRASMKTKWWIHGEPRRGLRLAIEGLLRCVVTPEVAKYRLFVWMDTSVVPDHKLHVFARDDDYFLGVLHSRAHEVWSLAQGSWMGVGNDPSYSSSRTFETFPFPFPPSLEPKDDPRVNAITEAAAELVKLRDAWLNPPGASESELKKRTLTNLYNQRPTWLDNAHRRLDEAVFAAYGWPAELSDDEILARLLALNLERAAAQGAVTDGEEVEEADEE